MIRRLLLASLGAFFVIGSGEPALAADPEVWPPVAQSQWLDVDCGAAKLTTTASPLRCRRGPVFNDSGKAAVGPIDCVVEQWAVFTRSSASFGFARLANLRALRPSCRVRFGDIGTVLKSQYMTKDTTGWSDVSQIGDINAASFSSARGENCKAFAKFGPPWPSGFAWVLHGWLCGPQGKSVSDGDLQSLVSSLIVRVQ
jgi:hypothetical protein